MAEPPIKLFASPKSNIGRRSHSWWAGYGATVDGSRPAVKRRRDYWLKELADSLDQLETKVDGFKVENLVDNEAFISAAIQATQLAIRTHSQEKRKCCAMAC